ncbi:hypothetical protein SCHPADRAFT_995032 [Schizopora paradoxa]|uniref:Uncharacterized protein n=1 Tax=Schizopora paradoxa TaxID=27342 RepID=A0A0H2RX25_9AGAM|nr:hypothetical protein SCHPADRAFT_995032 [Schizopora paradoxa]
MTSGRVGASMKTWLSRVRLKLRASSRSKRGSSNTMTTKGEPENDKEKTSLQGNQEDGAIALNSESKTRHMDASREQRGCESLPEEILAQILELVAEWAWKEGFEDAPSVAEMSTFPLGRRGDDVTDEGEEDPDPDREELPYPLIFLLVSKRWHDITLDTPILWSYLTITDDSTFDEIGLRLHRSENSPLSIRLSYSGDEDNDEVQGYQMSLLTPHAERWLRFIASSDDPVLLCLFAPIISEESHRMQRLVEYAVKNTPNSDEFGYFPCNIPIFDSPMPSLRKLTLSYEQFPLELLPDTKPTISIQDMFPSLTELELAQMDGLIFASLLKSLDGVPQLRALKINGFHYRHSQRKLIEAAGLVDLKSLEELTIQEIDDEALEFFLDLVSIPNLSSINFIGSQLPQSFVNAKPEHLNLSNIRKLSLISTRFEVDGDEVGHRSQEQLASQLLAEMSGVTSIHCNHICQFFARALLRDPKLEPSSDSYPLLPKLTEISLSGFDGDEIIDIVKERQSVGIPLATLIIDERSILSGAVALRHWEDLQGQVEALRWFKTNVDYEEFLASSLQRLGLRF